MGSRLFNPAIVGDAANAVDGSAAAPRPASIA